MSPNLFDRSKEEDRQRKLVDQSIKAFNDFFNAINELDAHHRKQASEKLITLLIAKNIFTTEQVNSILETYQLLCGKK
jgi:hypothetical protein